MKMGVDEACGGGCCFGFLDHGNPTVYYVVSKCNASSAEVVKLVDTGDLKSPGPNGPYGFKSRLRHFRLQRKSQLPFASFFLRISNIDPASSWDISVSSTTSLNSMSSGGISSTKGE